MVRRGALLRVLVASFYLPELLAEAATSDPTFEGEFEKYRTQASHKAFALAVDSTGRWASGYVYGAASSDEAERGAVARCEGAARQYLVAAPCQVLAKENSLVGPMPGLQSASAPTYEVRWVNGTNFVIGRSGEVQIWISFLAGRDPQAFVYLVNGGDRIVTFAPESIRATAVRANRKGPVRSPVKVYGPAEYEKRVRTKQAWQAALHGAAVALANQPQAQTSTFHGTYDAYRPFSPRSQVSGNYSGQITTWPNSADYAAANSRSAAQIQAMGTQLQASYKAMADSLLRTHTLDPGSYYGGVVHLQRFKGERIDLEIPFGDQFFRVNFDMP